MLDPRCDLTHNSLKSVKKNHCLENVIEFWIVNVYMFEHLVLTLQGELRCWSLVFWLLGDSKIKIRDFLTNSNPWEGGGTQTASRQQLFTL